MLESVGKPLEIHAVNQSAMREAIQTVALFANIHQPDRNIFHSA
jgi:hypothetical protein